MSEMNYEIMGRFIYGAHRHGGDAMDIANWMADDLGIPRPDGVVEGFDHGLYTAFFAKYDDDQLQENLARFLEKLKNRPS